MMAEYDVCECCNLKVANGPIAASTWKAHAESAEREVARLQTALEGAEARDRLRGATAARVIWRIRLLRERGYSDRIRQHDLEVAIAEAEAAIDIKPDEAREKEGQ